MKNPPHFPLAVSTVNYGRWCCVLPHRNRLARCPDLIDVKYETLKAVVDLEEVLTDNVIVHEDLGPIRATYGT